MSEVTYHCSVCGKEAKVEEGKPAPLCCQRKWNLCLTARYPQTAEHARSATPTSPATMGPAGGSATSPANQAFPLCARLGPGQPVIES